MESKGNGEKDVKWINTELLYICILVCGKSQRFVYNIQWKLSFT